MINNAFLRVRGRHGECDALTGNAASDLRIPTVIRPSFVMKSDSVCVYNHNAGLTCPALAALGVISARHLRYMLQNSGVSISLETNSP